MKNILLFGAGKSATVLIDFLNKITIEKGWIATIADANYNQIVSKTNNFQNIKAVEVDIVNEIQRSTLIEKADIVISLMPPSLHILIAKDCIKYKKNLLTASYIDNEIRVLKSDIEANSLLFLYEMGLDPGLDHMSAMQLLHRIKLQGETVTKFYSHCGGLVSKQNDDNPWHYKISWNPRNVVMAGKAGATYLKNGIEVSNSYQDLFANLPQIKTPLDEEFSYYPNRDSLSYINLYELQDITDFVRTTLRHPDFMKGWKNVINFQLTNEEKSYSTDEMHLKSFFKTHFHKIVTENYSANLPNSNSHYESEAMHQIKSNSSLNEQMLFLGIEDDKTYINKGLCSAADVLQFALEKKLVLQPNDKDRVVMLHEIETQKNGIVKQYKCLLDIDGENNSSTAMAKTVGLPLGIAAVLILEGKIDTKGLQIPILPEIYTPILKALEFEGILFKEFEI